jgi:uncharacterized membrane protein
MRMPRRGTGCYGWVDIQGVFNQNRAVSQASFSEDRIFIISWGVFIGIMTLILTGVIAAPLFEFWGAGGLADFLYRAYHLSCHQLPSRSWFICGAKLGVCVRCLATYLFFIPMGAALFIRSAREWLIRRSFLKFVLPISLAFLSPLVIDGLLQLITPWESTNLLRFATGALAGVGTALLFGYLFLKFIERVDASLP